MFNSPFVWQQSERLAQRIQSEAGNATSSQIDLLYQVALSRPPTLQEQELGLAFLSEQDASKETFTRYCHAILGLNEFIYVP